MAARRDRRDRGGRLSLRGAEPTHALPLRRLEEQAVLRRLSCRHQIQGRALRLARAALLSLDTLADDLELAPASLTGLQGVAAERDETERSGAPDGFARGVISKLEVEPSDIR